MKTLRALFYTILFLCGLLFGTNEAQTTKVGGQLYLTYVDGKVLGITTSQFNVKRAYINVRSQINEYISARITPDISIDRDGDSIGDLELRLKYCYAKFKAPDLGIFYKPYSEVGIAHRPWLNFEENLNGYRAQGAMYLPRNGVVSSADYGILVGSLLGGEMDKEYQESVSKSYPGKYGSIAVGIFNGGGYHDLERNKNKPIETRVSLRPFPEMIPGFQISYAGAYGKGNTEEAPDWIMNMGFASWESKRFVLTGSDYKGLGNFLGTAVDSLGNSLDQSGYSVFGELRIHEINCSLFARYDYMDQEKYSVTNKREIFILGWAYHFHKSNKIFIDYNRRDDGISTYNGKDKDSDYVELALEINL